MIKYAKIIDNEKGLVEVGLGTNEEYYKSIGMIQLDVDKSDIDNNWYLSEKCPHKSEEQKLQEAKTSKNTENTTKAKQAIEDGYVVFKEAQFETNAQTVGDLTATMLIMQQTGMESYDWLSRDDKVVTLTVEDFGTLGGLIATYKNTVWNTKYIGFKEQIEEATTIEEVKAIDIDYDVPTILEELANENTTDTTDESVQTELPTIEEGE